MKPCLVYVLFKGNKVISIGYLSGVLQFKGKTVTFERIDIRNKKQILNGNEHSIANGVYLNVTALY